ncbi:MAG: helicase-related protein [Myxococcota bacterium]
MALDPAEYHALLRLLDPGRFDDPRAFKSITQRVGRIRDLGQQIANAMEQNKVLPKAAQAKAQEIFADDEEDKANLQRFVKPKATIKERAESAEGLLESLRQRHGLADYVVRNRRGPVGGMPQRCPQVFALEPSEVQEQVIDIGEGVMFDLVSGLEDPAERYATLGSLLRALWSTPRALLDILQPISPNLAAQLAPYIAKVVAAPLDQEGLPTGDTRLRWLASLIRRQEDGDKLLVFVESPIAVRALKDSLDAVIGGDIAMFHRGMSPRDQDRQVAWFRDVHGPQVMLSTEAGGEGRNFQFCHQVVLYDLPWRPATIEQRIGRIDRVGQAHDVHVLVPYFKSGYEAAILKVMQESIGVLDRTVGGIDHALEYVSDRLAELVLSGDGAEAWKALYLETEDLIKKTRHRIEAAVDPILDHASFRRNGLNRCCLGFPRISKPVRSSLCAATPGIANWTSITRAALGGGGGCTGGRGGANAESAYVATFSRAHGLDHEDVEFLSFGHPLVEQALEWARETGEAAAALAICRGFDRDGAVFCGTSV